MILTCPQCATQYRLKDGAIPPEGRQVRCAACKHKWHEPGSAEGEAAPAAAAPSPPPAAAPARAASAPAATHQAAPFATHAGDARGLSERDSGIAGGPPQPRPGAIERPGASVPDAAERDEGIAETPEPEVTGHAPAGHEHAGHQPAGGEHGLHHQDERAVPQASAASAWDAHHEPYPAADPDFAAIPAMHDEDEGRRGGKLGWIIGLILIVVAGAAAFYFFAPPELKARAGIAEAGESPLELMLTTSDRQKLASGNELLAISGRVINATDRVQAVPPIHAELRDPATNRLVYEWTIAPPARSLAPGAAASFNSAEVDVPQGGESLSLRFAS